MQSRDVKLMGVRKLESFNSVGQITSTVNEPVYVTRDILANPVSTTGKLPKPLVPHNFEYTKNRMVKGTARVDLSWVSSGDLAFRYTGQESDPSAVFNPALLPSNANVMNKALDKLNGKVRTNLDLSISAFEWKQTARMASQLSPAGLAKMERALFEKLSLRKDWRHLTKIPADLWLQYQYGLKPLMSDAWAAADEAIRVARNGLQSFEASSSQPLDGSYLLQNPEGYGSLRLEELKGNMIGKYGITFDAGITDANRAQHFSSLNPVSIAWEILPYSFVVDWFVDVGTLLRSYETSLMNNVAFKSGYKTELEFFDAKQVKTYGAFDPSVTFRIKVQSKSDGAYHFSHMRRTVLSSYPLPSLPRFKSNLGSEQLLSAASLLAQFLHAPFESKSYKKLLSSNVPDKIRRGGRNLNAQARALSNN